MPIVDRALGQAVPAGAWDAVFYRATHDGPTSNDDGLDTGFATHFPAIKGRRGAYHFAHPAASPASEQAHRFVSTVLANGFRVGVDLWALDIEQYPETGLGPWIAEFMTICTQLLGDRGFLYVGWPYFVTHVSHQDFSLLHRYRWWLPDYGPNDGKLHPISSGEPFLPVLHQFTSNPFDTSAIVSTAAWSALWTPGVTVHQQFTPPLQVISRTFFEHPKLGRCFAELGPDGGVFCEPANAYVGGVNGQGYFKGRKAARIVARTPVGYTIIDTAGEKYNFPDAAHGG